MHDFVFDDGRIQNIRLLDKKNIARNKVQVIKQFEQAGTHANRYDVTILVNGLPMVQVELKKRGVAIREAFNQINRYQHDSFWAGSGLFQYVQIFVISNGTYTKYYSNTVRDQHIKEAGGTTRIKKTSNSYEFTSWWADANNKPIYDLMSFGKTFFAKHSLLNILTKYCVFTSDQMLLTMRPYQIVATERVLQKIVMSENQKTFGTLDAGGYVWHTTGSGKTLAFGLAMLTNLNGRVAKPHKPLGLVLTPTRELAQQIDEVLTPLAKSIGLDSVVIAGGMPYAKQITAMRQSCPILVATPGRLIDLLDKGEVQLDHLQITVLDEADQMADMGFLPVVKEILDQAKPDGQRLLFSATLDRGVDALVKKYLNDPKTHSLQNDRASVSTMKHYVLTMQTTDKDDVTAQIASRSGKTILFVKTQRGADRLCDKLAHAGVPVGALHGGKSQAVRTRTLALFKETPNAALVATDVAARGIHVDGISLVVHFDAPTDHKDYLHRSGRTARAGEEGNVVLLSTTKSQSGVKSLTSRAGVTPIFVHVEPMSNELIDITGAVEPSGIPYVAPVMENKGPSRGNRRPRPNSNERRRRPR